MPNWKILVVEDDPSLQQLYQLDFTDAGLDIALASNGLEAAKILTKWQPDLVVTDIRMPEAGGESVMDVIELNYPRIPVIIVSAYKNYKDIFKSDHRVILGFYLKPVDFNELADYIKAYLGGKVPSGTGLPTPGPVGKARAPLPKLEVPEPLPDPTPHPHDPKAHSLEILTPMTDPQVDGDPSDFHRGTTK